MAYIEYQTPQGALGYEITEHGIILTSYRGKDISLEIPNEIDGRKIVAIAKKTFLSAKTLCELRLPISVEEIHDFAFAYCSRLKILWIPKAVTTLGIGLFKECEALAEIHLLENNASIDCLENQKELDTACLLAATVGILNAPYLFDFHNAGKDGWLEHWDMRMMTIMQIDDMEGYSKLLLCGEEDYGSNENNVDLYVANNKKAKCRLALLRLQHPYGLSEERKDFLVEYLISHSKGHETEEAWQVLIEEHGDEKDYYELFIQTGCISKENIQSILEEMGEQHAEMKVFLLRYQVEHWSGDNFFDELEL